jgi:hypothetical protein
MSSTQYLPREAQAFYNWAQNFGNYAASAGNPFQLAEGDLAALLAALYRILKPPAPTKNSHHKKTDPGGHADPNTKSLRRLIRQLVKQIKANPNVPTPTLQAGGLPPRSGKKPKKPKPATPITPAVKPAGPATVIITLLDGVDPTATTKPASAAGALIYYSTSPVRPTSTADGVLLTQTGKLRTQVTMPASTRGQTVWIFAVWLGSRGDVGPMGTPLQAVIT